MQIAREYAEACLRWDSDQIPVLIRLGEYSSSNNLRMLILNRLRRGETIISELELTGLLQQGRLILLLDAFDEIIDTYFHDLQQEIASLLSDFECPVVITSRHFRLPQLSFRAKYEIQPLSLQKILAFSKMYLGSVHLEFVKEIIRKGLGNVASNTLLLTLLILLYMNNQDLPLSQTQVMSAVVKQIENWSRSKPQRFQQPLSWQIKLNILSKLAFVSFTQGESYIHLMLKKWMRPW